MFPPKYYQSSIIQQSNSPQNDLTSWSTNYLKRGGDFLRKYKPCGFSYLDISSFCYVISNLKLTFLNCCFVHISFFYYAFWIMSKMSALYWENFRPNVFLSIEYPNRPFSLVCIELRKKRTEMFRSTSKSFQENFYKIPLRSQI